MHNKFEHSLHALPLVSSHFQFAADVHSEPDPQPVADEHIQHVCIPPALSEIGQQMRERHFSDLPRDTQCPTYAVMSHKHCLHCPSDEVRPREHVHMTPYALNSDVSTVHCILLTKSNMQIITHRLLECNSL